MLATWVMVAEVFVSDRFIFLVIGSLQLLNKIEDKKTQNSAVNFISIPFEYHLLFLHYNDNNKNKMRTWSVLVFFMSIFKDAIADALS